MFDFLTNPPHTYFGMRIVEARHMTEGFEDWSGCRSPSRARRRRAQGHPQRVAYRQRPMSVIYQMGNSLVMHPEIARQFRAQAAKLTPR